MDWNKIIKFAKAQGYTGGDADAPAVKSFLAAKLITLSDGTKDIDVEAEYKSHAEAARATRVVLGDDETDTLKAQLAESQAATKAATEQARKAASTAAKASGVDAVEAPAIGGVHGAAKKAYNHKAKTGGTMFADADAAEMFGAIARKSLMGNRPYAQKANDDAIVGKALVEFDNTLGGYLVPTEFVSNLLYSTEISGTARKVANVVRMAKEVQQTPRKTSIPTMNWESETQSSTAQNVGFDMVELIARKLKAVINSSTELLEDSAVSVADAIATSVREGYDIAIDNAYFLGDGTSTYGGYSGLANALPAAAYINGAGAWSAFTTGNFNEAFGRLQNIANNRLAIVCSRQFYHQVCVRLDKATSQFKPLIEGAMADGAFLGVPVYFAQVMPTTTGSGVKSCYIGDFKAASMVGERRDLAIASSEHALFSSDMIQWRATARAAINIHGDGRGSTYGPVVCLNATA